MEAELPLDLGKMPSKVIAARVKRSSLMACFDLCSMQRAAELEERAAAAMHRNRELEEELAHMQTHLGELERAIGQQERDSKPEQDRHSTLVATLGQQHSSMEAEVRQLLLASAGERHRADLAEQALQGIGERVGACEKALGEAQDKLAHEEALRHAETHKVLELEGKLERAEAQLHKARQLVGQVLEIHGQKSAEQPAWGEAVHLAAHEEAQFEAPRQQRVDEKVQALEDLVLETDRKLHQAQQSIIELQEKQGVAKAEDGPEGSDDWQRQFAQVMLQLADKEWKCQELEDKLMKKNREINRLQQQMVNQVNKGAAAQAQIVEKVCQHEAKSAVGKFDNLAQQRAARRDAIEKEREVCELQQQLTAELTKRQATQCEVIEKDRLICSLKEKIKSLPETVASTPKYPTAPGGSAHVRKEVLKRETTRDSEPESTMQGDWMPTAACYQAQPVLTPQGGFKAPDGCYTPVGASRMAGFGNDTFPPTRPGFKYMYFLPSTVRPQTPSLVRDLPRTTNHFHSKPNQVQTRIALTSITF